MSQSDPPLLRFLSHHCTISGTRYKELVRRPWETLTAEERVELGMLPNPENPREDGSDVARALFRLTEHASHGGIDLDELMVILAEPVRAYLLFRGYVVEVKKITPFGRAIRYEWSKQTESWSARFD